MGSLERRLEALEGNLPVPEPPDRTEVRKRIKKNLDRLAALRRTDDPAARAELDAFAEAFEREKKRRGWSANEPLPRN